MERKGEKSTRNLNIDSTGLKYVGAND